jgi:hypothetical protein
MDRHRIPNHGSTIKQFSENGPVDILKTLLYNEERRPHSSLDRMSGAARVSVFCQENQVPNAPWYTPDQA